MRSSAGYNKTKPSRWGEARTKGASMKIEDRYTNRETRAEIRPAPAGAKCLAGWDYGEGCYRPATLLIADLWRAPSRTDLDLVPRCGYHAEQDHARQLSGLITGARMAREIEDRINADRAAAQAAGDTCPACFTDGSRCDECAAEDYAELQYEIRAGK